jgi:hypothetical protein
MAKLIRSVLERAKPNISEWNKRRSKDKLNEKSIIGQTSIASQTLRRTF